MLPQSGTTIWHVQQAYTANIKISLTAVLRITSHKSSAAVRLLVTRVLLNYRRLRCDGQRLRCAIRSAALSNRNTWGALQHSLYEHAQWLRQGFTLSLRYRWFFSKQP